MKDILHYKIPFGPIGSLADVVLVDRQIEPPAPASEVATVSSPERPVKDVVAEHYRRRPYLATVLKAFLVPTDRKPYRKYLERMGLDRPGNFEETLYQKLLVYEFSRFGKPG